MVKRYQAIEIVARWGRPASLATSIAAGLLASGWYWLDDQPLKAGVSVLVALLLYGVLRLSAELIEVISETLLPQ